MATTFKASLAETNTTNLDHVDPTVTRSSTVPSFYLPPVKYLDTTTELDTTFFLPPSANCLPPGTNAPPAAPDFHASLYQPDDQELSDASGSPDDDDDDDDDDWGTRGELNALNVPLTAESDEERQVRYTRHKFLLARVTRETCAARLVYQLSRIHELYAMRAIVQEPEEVDTVDLVCPVRRVEEVDALLATAHDAYQKSLALMGDADAKLVDMRNTLNSMGIPIPPPGYVSPDNYSPISSPIPGRVSCSRSVSPESQDGM